VKRLFLCLLMILTATPAAFAATQVNWEDLKDPKAAAFDDPFAALSIHQLRALGTILRLRQQLQDGTVAAEARSKVKRRLRREEAKLAVAGVDVDWLLSRRLEIGKKRAAASLAGNPSLAGKEVAIIGYVIPVEGPGSAPAGGGYLVPGAGMCSHMPAPDPNQMIRYTLSTDWEAGYVYEPVLLIGTLSLETTRQEITLLDGQIDMLASFQMKVTEVRSLDDQAAPKPKNRVWNLFRRPNTDTVTPVH